MIFQKKRQVEFSELSVYWISKDVGKRSFTQHSLKNVVSLLVPICFYIVKMLVFQWELTLPYFKQISLLLQIVKVD